MVPEAGLEPAQGCPHRHLKPARLPISPSRHNHCANHASIRYDMSDKLRLVPGAGIEPAWCKHRWILSPVRLPVPPPWLLDAINHAIKHTKSASICNFLQPGKNIWQYQYWFHNHCSYYGNRNASNQQNYRTEQRSKSHYNNRCFMMQQ